MNAVLTTPEARPGLARLDVAHRREQHRVERDAGADAEQDHARQHVDDEAPVDRRAREQQQPDARAAARRERRRIPKRITSFAESRAERERAHDQVRGRNARPTCSGL
jgi:hypothetical protein